MVAPDIYLPSILNITPKLLKEINVLGLIIDVDNTIRDYGKQYINNDILKWVEKMKQCGLIMVIASNNFKKNIEPIANVLNIPYVSLSFKPLPFGLKKAARKLNFKKENIAVVGDQYFTDIVGGKLQGFKTILLEPLTLEKGLIWKFRRSLEKKILYKILWKGEFFESNIWTCRKFC